MITKDSNPDVLAGEAEASMLQKTLKPMYTQGYRDGATAILLATADRLQTAASDEKCPDDIKNGYANASEFLSATLRGQQYDLLFKEHQDQSEQK